MDCNRILQTIFQGEKWMGVSTYENCYVSNRNGIRPQSNDC